MTRITGQAAAGLIPFIGDKIAASILFSPNHANCRRFRSLLEKQSAAAETQINADVVSLHLRYPFHPRNLRFPWQLFLNHR